MDLFKVFELVAMLTSPLIAVQVSQYLNKRKLKHELRMDIFSVLMTTRSSPLDTRRVEALNSISIAFEGKSFEKVREAWRTYFAHLNTERTDLSWDKEQARLYTELLKTMATAVGFTLDVGELTLPGYIPTGIQDIMNDATAMRVALRDVLQGRQSVRVVIEAQSSTSVQS